MLAGLLFVDDTDFIVICEDGEDDTVIIARLQNVIDAWQGALQTSGGSLQPDTCS
jgi:hypothetical protein